MYKDHSVDIYFRYNLILKILCGFVVMLSSQTWHLFYAKWYAKVWIILYTNSIYNKYFIWLHKKAKINFKIYDITYCTTNNFNTYIAQYLIRPKDNQAIKLGKLTNIMWEIFPLVHLAEIEPRKLIPDLFSFFKRASYKMKASGQHIF